MTALGPYGAKGGKYDIARDALHDTVSQIGQEAASLIIEQGVGHICR